MENSKSLAAYTGLEKFVNRFQQVQSVSYAEQQLKNMVKEMERLQNPPFLEKMFGNKKAREEELLEAKTAWEVTCRRPYPMIEMDDGSAWSAGRALTEMRCALENRYQMSEELWQECERSAGGQMALLDLQKQDPHISYRVGKQMEEIWKENQEKGLETRIHRTPCKDSQLAHILEKGLDINPDYLSDHAKDEKTVPDLDFTTARVSSFAQMLQFASTLDGTSYHSADGMLILGVDPEKPEFSYIDPDNRLNGSIDPSQIKAYVHREAGVLDTFATREAYLNDIWKERSPEELNKALEEHLKETANWMKVEKVPTSVYKIAEALEISAEDTKKLCDERTDLLTPSFVTKDGEQNYIFQAEQERDYLNHDKVFTRPQIEKEKEYTSVNQMLKEAQNERESLDKEMAVSPRIQEALEL